MKYQRLFLYYTKKGGVHTDAAAPVGGMRYSPYPESGCNQANLTDDSSWLKFFMPSSIFFTVFGEGCL